MASEDRRLVYVIVQDPLIGIKPEARIVDLLPDGTFSLNHIRIDPFNYRNFEVTISEDDKALLKILRDLTYDRLVANFSKINSELPDLLHTRGDDFFKKIFRPYVERRLVSVIDFCREHAISLYPLGNTGTISEVPYFFAEEKAVITYHFQWTPQALTYAIRMSVGGRRIDLTGPSLILLTDQPAWFAYQGGLYTLDEGVNGNKIKPFLTRNSLVVPQQTEKKYFDTFIRSLLRQSSISQSGFIVQEVNPLPEPVALLTVDWNGEAVVILKFGYEGNVIPMDHSDPRLVEMDPSSHPPSFRVIVRNPEAEKGITGLLLSMGLTPKGTGAFRIGSPSGDPQDPRIRLVEFAREHFTRLEEAGIRLDQDPGSRLLFQPPVIHTNLSGERDWFDLEVEISVGESRIPFRALKESILSGRHEYFLPDGSVFLIPDEWFSRFRGIFLFGKADGNRYKVDKRHLGSLDRALAGEGMDDPGTPAAMIRRIFDSGAELHGSAAGILRPYQQIGARWLTGLQGAGYGGCLADDMGLGKTVQVLAMLENFHRGKSPDTEPSLVVMPVSLLHNWENEIRKFTPSLRSYRLAGQQRNPNPAWLRAFDVILTTYGSVRNDVDQLESLEFAHLILDESQHAKNADSVTFRALNRIRATHRFSMTGTPVENSLEDLWAQMTLVNPGMLGSRNWFREHFVRSKDGAIPEDSSVLLRETVRPFILRRTKEAVAPELPQLTQEIRYCEPTEEQASVYEARKSEIRNFLIDRFREPVDSTTRMLILQSLMKLRLIANHPVMADATYRGDSGKLNELGAMLAEVIQENHKVLVFSQFVRHLKLIASTLDGMGVPYVMLTGQDPARRREQMIHRFQNEESLPVFLVSLKAGGVGLNLTRADYVFLADPWWNPAVENQAISRAHRIGQENHVFAYRFITSGTIEEKILQLQEKKQTLADIFVNRNALNLIHPEELLELLD